MTLQNIPLAAIETGKRLREVNAAQVEALVASIGDVGLLNPITVYASDRLVGGVSVPGFGLIAGAHRLEAAKRLGHGEIAANIVVLSDLERQIAECDENLCGTVLTPSEKSWFIKRRKDAYEALHPETKHGGDRKSDQVANLATRSEARFTADTAAKTGQSERAVQRAAERGDKIFSEALELIRGTHLDTGVYLDKIKNLSPSEQVFAVKRDLAYDRKLAREQAKANKAKVEKAAKKAQRVAEEAELDRQRQAHADALPQHIKDQEAAKQRAIDARKDNGEEGDGLSDADRIAELEESVRVLEAEAEELRAENKLYGEMKALFEKGGFEAVIAGKDEEIRVLETRLYAESRDKAGWKRSADHWKAEALKLGWSRDEVIDVETGETIDG